MDKSWLEVEMEESITLLRKRLEEINDYEVEEVDLDVVCEMEKIYRTLNHIMTIKKVLHP
mgnify:FL=1|nr:MAG TPA: hypothetical protein [Caudoviricetes sp.]